VEFSGVQSNKEGKIKPWLNVILWYYINMATKPLNNITINHVKNMKKTKEQKTAYFNQTSGSVRLRGFSWQEVAYLGRKGFSTGIKRDGFINCASIHTLNALVVELTSMGFVFTNDPEGSPNTPPNIV